MRTMWISAALLVGMVVGSVAAPTAAEVQVAMNDGIQLEYPQWQELSDLKIEKGGVTADGSYLFLCRAKIVWKVNSKAMVEELGKELKAQTQGAGGLVDSLGSLALAMASAQIGKFEKGGLVAEYPIRVKIVGAGDDWIVVDSEFGAGGNNNPLDKLDFSSGGSDK